MSKVFVYYSLSGNGDAVAGIMENKGYDILKVETAKRMPRSFFGQIMTGGFLAGIGNKAKLKTDISTLLSYDDIVVGTPVWNARLAPAVNTVVANIDKPFSIVCYSGSGKGKKIAKQLKNKQVERIVHIKQPKDDLDACEAALSCFDAPPDADAPAAE